MKIAFHFLLKERTKVKMRILEKPSIIDIKDHQDQATKNPKNSKQDPQSKDF